MGYGSVSAIVAGCGLIIEVNTVIRGKLDTIADIGQRLKEAVQIAWLCTFDENKWATDDFTSVGDNQA